MNPAGTLTAAAVLNTYSEEEIKNILKEFGEEPRATQIARRVALKRKTKKFKTVADLLKTIEETYRGKVKPRRIHFATRSWQALRIEVNQELASLEKFLPQALDLLVPHGRLAVISFHSLEDRIVKHYFRQESKDCICPPQMPVCQCSHKKQIKILTKKPITASEQEIKNNPRARSAKLRVAEKI